MKVSKNNITNTFYMLLICILSLIVAFKGETRDTELYLNVFQNIEKFSFDPVEFYRTAGVEVGFGVLNYLIHLFTQCFSIYSYIISILIFYFIKLSADKLNIRFIDVLFFYLPTLFITQQLMQLRQGLSCSIIIYALLIYLVQNRFYKGLFWGLIAMSIHSASVCFFPLFIRQVKNYISTNHRLYLKVFIWFVILFVLCRLSMNFSVLTSISSRVSDYQNSDYAEAREIFELANIRSLLLLFFFLYAARYHTNLAYNALIFIYTTNVAIRFGFYDFGILSGRLGITFGFCEIFLLTMSVKAIFGKFFYVFALLYLIVHTYITLEYQVPYMLDDYFSPTYF